MPLTPVFKPPGSTDHLLFTPAIKDVSDQQVVAPIPFDLDISLQICTSALFLCQHEYFIEATIVTLGEPCIQQGINFTGFHLG